LNLATTPDASKKTTWFKSGQEWLENDHLSLFILKPWNTLNLGTFAALRSVVLYVGSMAAHQGVI